mgnify:CR=1 FL=1
MRTKGPTLHEVAERAGVSIATVSRVARGLDQISDETRARVQAAIDELNYRPSHFGQALVRRRHGTLGIVFPGISGPYYSEVIHGYEMEAIGGPTRGRWAQLAVEHGGAQLRRGEPIGIPRLLARPTATLSLEAQQRRELRQKLYGD